jgi:hypothetical protein
MTTSIVHEEAGAVNPQNVTTWPTIDEVIAALRLREFFCLELAGRVDAEGWRVHPDAVRALIDDLRGHHPVYRRMIDDQQERPASFLVEEFVGFAEESGAEAFGIVSGSRVAYLLDPGNAEGDILVSNEELHGSRVFRGAGNAEGVDTLGVVLAYLPPVGDGKAGAMGA